MVFISHVWAPSEITTGDIPPAAWQMLRFPNKFGLDNQRWKPFQNLTFFNWKLEVTDLQLRELNEITFCSSIICTGCSINSGCYNLQCLSFHSICSTTMKTLFVPSLFLTLHTSFLHREIFLNLCNSPLIFARIFWGCCRPKETTSNIWTDSVSILPCSIESYTGRINKWIDNEKNRNDSVKYRLTISG